MTHLRIQLQPQMFAAMEQLVIGHVVILLNLTHKNKNGIGLK